MTLSSCERLETCFWTLTASIAIIFILGMMAPSTAGPERIVGLTTMAAMAPLWFWLSEKGQKELWK